MNRAEYLLTIKAEEGVEVSQRATKALRFGVNEIQPGQNLTNAQRLMDEYEDLHIRIQLLREAGLVKDLPHDPARIAAKRAKIERFMDYSRELGVLVDSEPITQPI